MQKFMKKRKARGFTLIELLIVIIIIGILAGALLLAAGAGTDKAEATRIVSDLRTIKTAAVMYYADYGDWPASNDDAAGNWLESWDAYADRALSTDVFDIQTMTLSVPDESALCVGRINVAEDGVQEELEKIQNKNGGLFDENGADYAKGSSKVYIRIK